MKQEETIAEMLARIAALEEAHADEVRPHYRARQARGDVGQVRSLRVSDDLWERAKKRADEKGETVSEAVRKFLERYVR